MKLRPKVYAIKHRGEIIYVGQTSHAAESRFWEHISRAKSGRNSCPKLYDHMKKHVFTGYTLEILEFVHEEHQPDEREQFWIAKLKSQDQCNTTPGGKVARGKDHYMWGKKARPETVAASIAAHTGKPLSQEWKDAISRGNKGKKRPDGFPVICTTTGEEFHSILAASKAYNVTMFTMQQIVYGRSDPKLRRKLRDLDFKLKQKDLHGD